MENRTKQRIPKGFVAQINLFGGYDIVPKVTKKKRQRPKIEEEVKEIIGNILPPLKPFLSS